MAHEIRKVDHEKIPWKHLKPIDEGDYDLARQRRFRAGRCSLKQQARVPQSTNRHHVLDSGLVQIAGQEVCLKRQLAIDMDALLWNHEFV